MGGGPDPLPPPDPEPPPRRPDFLFFRVLATFLLGPLRFPSGKFNCLEPMILRDSGAPNLQDARLAAPYTYVQCSPTTRITELRLDGQATLGVEQGL